MGIALKGDFIGFWIDNIHSSELGIIRTSDGSRFNENLLPTIQDKTVQVPGGDGFYYFGSYYTQRQFNIPIAFDNLEEKEFRRLRQIIGSKKMVKLVFDEAPYKYYSVKSTGNPILKYICFDVEVESSGGGADDEETQPGDSTPTQASAAENQDITNGAVYYQSPSSVTTKRVYKGEGTLNFIAYDPFGYTRATGLDVLELPKAIEGLELKPEEWSFLMTDDTGTYLYPLPDITQTGAWEGSGDGGTEGQMSRTVNSGDVECDYQIICKPGSGNKINIISYQFVNNELDEQNERITLILEDFELNEEQGHVGFCFDSKTNCVYGCTAIGTAKKLIGDTPDEMSFITKEGTEIDYTGDIYNQYLTAANFAKMPVGAQSFFITGVTTDAPYVDIKFRYF